jgi:poly(3-hydroxybutyrate) depolymerase
LPDNYDPARAYPLVFLWKGCSGGDLAVYPLQNLAGADVILAHGDFAPGADCYDTADGAAFVDLPFFDAFLADIEANYCVDEAHVYSFGFSSGAWLTHLLGCQRGDVLRGIGSVAGGFKPSFMTADRASCAGQVAAFMVSDLDDMSNPFYDLDDDGDSVEIAVNQWLTTAGCSETAWTMEAGQPSGPDMELCREYAGCGDFPIRLCLTSGLGHSDQQPLAMPGFWQLISDTLPE